MTKNAALGDVHGILCHFNLAFEKDWEVAEELNNRTKQNGDITTIDLSFRESLYPAWSCIQSQFKEA